MQINAKTAKEISRRASSRSGFTLVELLVVVAIIGILGTVAVINVPKWLNNARVTACREVIATIETSLNAYYADHGRLPDSLEALVSSTDDEDPYIKGGKDKLMDPWGTTIDYKPGRRGNFELRSAGPDLQPGNDDDITNDTAAGK